MKDYSLEEMIEMAKNSEYGAVWFSEKGPINITPDGELQIIELMELPKYKEE